MEEFARRKESEREFGTCICWQDLVAGIKLNIAQVPLYLLCPLLGLILEKLSQINPT
jgi:hypothetical protein